MDKIDQNTITTAGKLGSSKIADAFSILSGTRVTVDITEAQKVLSKQAIEEIYPYHEYSVIVYSTFSKNTTGGVILVMNRKDALVLADLLRKKPIGTSNILKDIDRSAIKETLNILANSFVSAVSEVSHTEITISSPSMITSDKLDHIIDKILDTESVIIFKTTLNVTQYEMHANLYLILN